jgi:hypothetical protein
MQKTAEEILAGSTRKAVPFSTGDEQFGDGYILVMSGSDFSAWARYQQREDVLDAKGIALNPHFYRAKLVQLVWCDENGKLIFNEGQVPTIAENVKILTINSIWYEAIKINGLSAEAVAEARANFPKTPLSATGSVSLGNAESQTLKTSS